MKPKLKKLALEMKKLRREQAIEARRRRRYGNAMPFDVKKTLDRYRQSALGLNPDRKEDEVSFYKRGERVRLKLVPSNWQQVVLWAVINALGIFMLRIVYVDTFGKPDPDAITPSNFSTDVR